MSDSELVETLLRGLSVGAGRGRRRQHGLRRLRRWGGAASPQVVPGFTPG
jgi:hypothetical protein